MYTEINKYIFLQFQLVEMNLIGDGKITDGFSTLGSWHLYKSQMQFK